MWNDLSSRLTVYYLKRNSPQDPNRNDRITSHETELRTDVKIAGVKTAFYDIFPSCSTTFISLRLKPIKTE